MEQKLLNSLTKKPAGSRAQVSISGGVQWLIQCKYDISQNYMAATPNNPESVSWWVKLENGNYMHLFFEHKGVYNTPDHVCIASIAEPYVHERIGGTNIQHDSLGFLTPLQQHIKNETGVNIANTFCMATGEKLGG